VSVVSEAVTPEPFGVGLPLDTQVSRPRAGSVLLEVDGEIDTLTAARLQAGLDEALDVARSEGSGVVVDLSGVTPPAGWRCSSAVPGAWPGSARGCGSSPPPVPSPVRCR
jgi:hypothetical protein